MLLNSPTDYIIIMDRYEQSNFGCKKRGLRPLKLKQFLLKHKLR